MKSSGKEHIARRARARRKYADIADGKYTPPEYAKEQMRRKPYVAENVNIIHDEITGDDTNEN